MTARTPSNDSTLAKIYFDFATKTPEGKVQCKKCAVFCKDNSGHGNLASHVKKNILSGKKFLMNIFWELLEMGIDLWKIL